MIFKSFIVCLYLMFIYWLSSLNPLLKMLFYPTLGAIAFFFITRVTEVRGLIKISVAAATASTIGSFLYFSDFGLSAFFITSLVTIFMIQYFKLNAAPILAISLLPFYAHPEAMWTIPLSVSCSLSGLILTLCLSQKIEEKARTLFRNHVKKQRHQVETEQAAS